MKLGDFGIARVLSSTRENARTIVGTPYYLSPEIVENKPYSFKSDVWSLGVLLYEMCALEPPFNGKSIHELALQIVRVNFKPIPDKYSEGLSELVNSLLLPDPEKRPTVNQILKHHLIAPRVEDFLSNEEFISEFSHTVLHNQNIFAETKR